MDVFKGKPLAPLKKEEKKKVKSCSEILPLQALSEMTD